MVITHFMLDNGQVVAHTLAGDRNAKVIPGSRAEKLGQLTLSVAMCTYNGGRYLQRQLETIARQTVVPDELVVFDDRSTDDTVVQLEAFARQVYFPVRIHVNECRLGVAKNFGACVSHCRGDIVVLTDQDDLWTTDRLERTCDKFADDPDLSYTYSDADLIDVEDRMLGRKIFDSVPVLSSDRVLLHNGHDLLAVILRYGVLYGTTMSIRRRDALRVLPIPALWSHDEWLSLALSAIGRSARLLPVTHYRQHESQVVGAGDARLTTTITSARNRTVEYYALEAARQRTGLVAALENPWLKTTLAPHLESKLRFIEGRQRLHQTGMIAIFGLIKQVGIGGYARYAAGSRSILKDVAMMIVATVKRQPASDRH